MQRAERLLSGHMAVEAVADELGLHKETVNQIKQGTHPQQRARLQLKRCPGCGGKVLMPCKLCAVRALPKAA